VAVRGGISRDVTEAVAGRGCVASLSVRERAGGSGEAEDLVRGGVDEKVGGLAGDVGEGAGGQEPAGCFLQGVMVAASRNPAESLTAALAAPRVMPACQRSQDRLAVRHRRVLSGGHGQEPGPGGYVDGLGPAQRVQAPGQRVGR
jgi:hypothetical protein